MNCANHPDRERAAFCQNCGKPLCNECVRSLGSSIYCEQCFAARASASTPPPGYAAYPPVTAAGYGAPGRGAPNPSIAALLGFIPGVGAMYNEQYAKGIVHLLVFAVLISMANQVDIFWLFVWGWVFYMVIEAHHTARARRDGTPLPNPFGLNDISERLGFGRAWPTPPSAYPASAPYVDPASQPAQPMPGAPPDPPAAPGNAYAPPYGYGYVPPVSHWGAPQDFTRYGVPPVPPIPPVPPVPLYPEPEDLAYNRRFPAAAIWLIVLGLVFLIGNTTRLRFFRGHLLGPILVIGFGIWTFVRKMTGSGQGLENDGTAFYRWRFASAVKSSLWLVVFGTVWLLFTLHLLPWSWPLFWPMVLIAAGVTLLFNRIVHPGYYGQDYRNDAGYAGPSAPPAATPPVAPVTTTELAPRDPLQHPRDRQEGR